MPLHILILGAGISGLTSALALQKYLPDPKPKITIVEIRSSPSTIGGAVNLMPKAVRYLDHLGVLERLKSSGAGAECKAIELFDLYSGKKTAEVDFRGPDGDGIGKAGSKYFAMRIMRRDLQRGLLDAVEEQEGCEVVFGKRATRIEESGDGVSVGFEDGSEIKADLLLGCDGIHSAVRTLLIDPERAPTYTGIASSMATSKVRHEKQLRWHTTGFTSSRRGRFACSYFESSREQQYVAIVVETEEVDSREGWRLKGSDQEAMKRQILDRFDSAAMPELKELVEDAGEWTLYPVYKLPPGGKWISRGGRCILLGDAAHAMPPQGESTGICMEDAIVFSRAMMKHHEASLSSIFKAYERIRRPVAEAAYQQAAQRWETVKDRGWLKHNLFTWATPWLLRWTSKAREDSFTEDFTDLDVVIEE